MSYPEMSFYRTFVAAADLDGKEGYGVTIDADGRVSLAELTDYCIGVVFDVLQTGAGGRVVVRLPVPAMKVKAGGAVNEAATVACDSTTDGEFIASSGTDKVFGIALTAAADGDMFDILPIAPTAHGSV